MTAPARPLTPKERAAAKAALSRSIKMRQRELAKLRLLVPDDYLQGVIERLEREAQELASRRAQLDRRQAPQLPELASRYLGSDRDPRRTRAQEEARDRAITRREASQQAREAIRQVPRCRHDDIARFCPSCNSTPIEEVPF